MFRLHRSKGTKSGERIDFKFANFQANQVPKGWDKLFVSIISVETGKTLAKSSKALVRNGSCLWRETLTESVWVAQDHSSKELEECSFRFVVAMGSSRSGILGEATVNVTGYIDSITPVPLSFTLKKCSHGTTLQVNLHCSAPRNRFREEEQDGISSHSGDFDAKSDGSQGSFGRSFGSSSGKDPDSNSQVGGTPSRATSLSASDSRRSSISADGSTGRGAFSPRHMLNSDKYSSVTRQDSSGLPSMTPKSMEDSSRSNYSSLSSKDTGTESGQIALLKNVGSSKSLLEAAENTIDEIRLEAKMWERNARKLMVDLDVLKKEFSDQSSSKDNLVLELSAARTEIGGLKKEIRQLELSLEDMKLKQKVPEYSTSTSHIEKGLEDEIKFNRESNSELALQLKKAQESNIELLSILQELEETIETQKVEIQELSDLNLKSNHKDRSIHAGFEESETVVTQLHSLEESQKLLLEKVKYLEQELKDKTSELETENSKRNKLQRNELEYNRILADKDEKILNLETKLSAFLEKGCAEEPTTINEGSTDLKSELDALKEKVQELERDCTELTDENLELLFKLKKSQSCSENEGSLSEFHLREPSSKSITISGTEAGETEGHNREADMDTRLQQVELELLEISKTFSEIFRQLQTSAALVNNPLQNIQKNDYERNANVIDNQVNLEDEATCTEKADLILRRLTEFSKELEAHVSANKILEKKMAELEITKQDQELHISELERENVQLSERISGLEAQLRYLTNEKESTSMELAKSQHLVSTLQDELLSLGKDMEQKLSDQKEKMEELQKRFLESQGEIEYLNASNSKLQATAENVMEECGSLQNSNAKLRSQKLELHEQCTNLEAELRDMKEKFTSCSRSVESLENNLSLMLEDFLSKEKRLTSELDAVLDEHGHHKEEQLVLGESLLNQLYEDKTLEAERLQKEVDRLTQQIYSTHDGRETMASDALQEVSRLSEDNAKLGSVLRETQSKTVQLENELKNALTESNMKVQSLMVEITALKQGSEIMTADSEKMTKLVETSKMNEDRLRTTANNLELKLTVSEYERQQVLEESVGLKIRLEKAENLKEEITSLKSTLNTAKLERDRLESSLQLMTGDCETLKAEKTILTEKASVLEKAASAYEDCKRAKNSLEEKILRLEGDMIAKEATCAQDIELKNELGRIKSENRQLQRKIEKLEYENDQLFKKHRVVDEELKSLKEAKHGQNAKRDNIVSTDQRRMSRRKASFKASQGQEHLQSERITNGDQYQGQVDDTNKFGEELGFDSLSRIQTLENDLADALEANHLYKLQLKRLSEGNNNTMTRSKSSMEIELRDIKERYLHMSLKYAEVETQREELVMKLKAARNGNKWF